MADCSCILCNESAEGLKNKRIKLTDKGSRGIRKASKERGESVDAKEGDYVHEKCRRDYCLKQNIDRAKRQSLSATPVIPWPLVRAVESTFRFDRNCFFSPATTQANRVPRRNVTQEEVAKAGKVEIKPPSDGRLEELNIVYNDVLSITVQDPTANLDVLWKTSLPLSAERPAWSGLMQAVHEGNHTGKSSVLYFPMIDMTTSDVTCVMSTLNFVSRHAKSHDILTPIITFDQPLWLKAFSIVNTEPADSEVRNVVVRLGAFHAQMSFLGAIGHLMAESGLKELLEMIYASNAVDHMLSGKAVSRAVRGHLIIDAALNAPLYSSALGIPITRIQQGTCNLLSDANTREFGNHTDLKDFAKFQILNLPSSRRSNRRSAA